MTMPDPAARKHDARRARDEFAAAGAPSAGASPGASPGASAAPPELRLKVPSDPANVASVRRACEAFCLECGLDANAAADVGLVVNEAMANIIRHAYSGATDQPVAVTGRCDCGPGSATGVASSAGVTIDLRDWGTGFNPESVRTDHDPMQPGGLGLLCIRCLVDDAVFSPQPDGMLLTLTKRKKK